MIEVYFNHTTVTRSITEVYLLYTYPVLILIRVLSQVKRMASLPLSPSDDV